MALDKPESQSVSLDQPLQKGSDRLEPGLDQPPGGDSDWLKTRLDQPPKGGSDRPIMSLDQPSQEGNDWPMMSLDHSSKEDSDWLKSNSQREDVTGTSESDPEDKEYEDPHKKSGSGSDLNKSESDKMSDEDNDVIISPKSRRAVKEVKDAKAPRDDQSDGSIDVEDLLDNPGPGDDSRYYSKETNESDKDEKSEHDKITHDRDATSETDPGDTDALKKSKRRSKKQK